MGYRFELDHVAMPGVASIFMILFILYEFCPSVLLFIPIGIFVVVYGTKNKRCDPRDVSYSTLESSFSDIFFKFLLLVTFPENLPFLTPSS